MKRTLLLLAVFMVIHAGKGYAQENVAKLNLTGLLFLNFGLSYERAFNDNMSGALTVSYMPGRGLPFVSLFEGAGGDSTLTSPFKDMTISGVGIMPEFRFYTSSSDDAPRGFYVGPYLKYSSIKLTSSFTDTYFDVNNVKQTGTIGLIGKYSAVGGGISIGYQWLISDVVSIDWTFIGLGYGNAKVSMTISSDDLDTSDLEAEAIDLEADIAGFGTATITVEPNSVTISAKRGWPVLRGGITLGFAF